jgi:hypothetical protein
MLKTAGTLQNSKCNRIIDVGVVVVGKNFFKFQLLSSLSISAFVWIADDLTNS